MSATLTVDDVEQLIIAALDTINDEQPSDEKFAVGPETVLSGSGAELDSVALVSFIVEVETSLNLDHDLALSLTDDRAMSRDPSPFDSVQTLKQYIVELAAEQS